MLMSWLHAAACGLPSVSCDRGDAVSSTSLSACVQASICLKVTEVKTLLLMLQGKLLFTKYNCYQLLTSTSKLVTSF